MNEARSTDAGDPTERALRADALRPRDERFTQDVLAALPPRTRPFAAGTGRSFAAASAVGIALALAAVAQRWYLAGAGGIDTLVAILLFCVPALAAAMRVCGPFIPRSFMRFTWRAGRNWR